MKYGLEQATITVAADMIARVHKEGRRSKDESYRAPEDLVIYGQSNAIET
jgi:hypothetical protein